MILTIHYKDCLSDFPLFKKAVTEWGVFERDLFLDEGLKEVTITFEQLDRGLVELPDRTSSKL